jgi:hypothetical protein
VAEQLDPQRRGARREQLGYAVHAAVAIPVGSTARAWRGCSLAIGGDAINGDAAASR